MIFVSLCVLCSKLGFCSFFVRVLCRILLSRFKHQRFSFLVGLIIIINCCCFSLLISIFYFFRSWIPLLMLPLFLHKMMVLPLHKLMVLLPPKLMVLLPPKKWLLLPKLKLLMLSCPQFHLAK